MPGPVQSIERAAAVLRLLARRPTLSLAEISGALGLAKGTAHGILTTLRGVGFVEQDRATGRYRIGEGLTQLADPGIDPHELRARSTNLADTLASNSGHAVRIAVLVDGRARIVHHVFRPDNSPQVLDVGVELPAHAHALGKVLLAYEVAVGEGDPVPALPADRQLERYTRRTLADTQALRRALVEVRARGWADELEERVPGHGSLAAALRGIGGLVVGAIGVSGTVESLCGARSVVRPDLVSLVQRTARSISRELGDLR